MKKKNVFLLLISLAAALLCVFPAAALSEQPLGYITDQAELLTEGEEAQLCARAEEIAGTYRCNVYIITLDDFQNYTDSGSAEVCAEELRTDYDLGYGAGRDCILLLLSMAERDYALCAHGAFANATFTDYGKEKLADAFLDDFRSDSWYAGFADYFNEAERLLGLSEDGTMPDITARHAVSPLAVLLASAVPAFGASIIICLVMRMGMRSVRARREAGAYVPSGGVTLTYRRDRFTHATHSRVYSPQSKSSGSGSTHRSSSGHSHSGGKF